MILAIDTSTSAVVLGLVGDDVRLERSLPAERAHAELLATAARALLAQAGNAGRASMIAIGRGPGSYTGLRVGASFGLGLGRAWNVPVVGVSSLEGIAATREGRVAASLDARKGMLYGAIYEIEAGDVKATHVPPGKYAQEEFHEFAQGSMIVHGETPSGIALASLARTRGLEDWQLEYL